MMLVEQGSQIWLVDLTLSVRPTSQIHNRTVFVTLKQACDVETRC
jgi:hypothetical protein